MVFKQVFEGPEKLIIILLIRITAKSVVPFDTRCQSTSGNIGGSNIYHTVIHIMKNVRFRMKRTILLIVKAQIHPVTQLSLDQIQC